MRILLKILGLGGIGFAAGTIVALARADETREFWDAIHYHATVVFFDALNFIIGVPYYMAASIFNP